MKKIISLTILIFITACIGTIQVSANSRKLNAGDLASVISRYENEEGFEIVEFGNLPLHLLKLVANATASEEDKNALDILDGISKFIVVEYYNSSPAKKEAFTKEISAVLDSVEKIIEIKENGSCVDIYGSLSKNGKTINDLVIHTSGECSIICFFGSVRMDDLVKITRMTND